MYDVDIVWYGSNEAMFLRVPNEYDLEKPSALCHEDGCVNIIDVKLYGV